MSPSQQHLKAGIQTDCFMQTTDHSSTNAQSNGSTTPTQLSTPPLSGSPPTPPPGQASKGPPTQQGENVEAEEYTALWEDIISQLAAPLEYRRFKDAFIYAMTTPPVTKESMKELNVESIVNNAKLRSDINYESKLAFRPTEDAEKQERLKKSKELFIKALAAEFEIIRFLHICRDGENGGKVKPLLQRLRIKSRVRKLMLSVKDILKDMIAEQDQLLLAQHFDVDLRFQEITRGSCDFVRITTWLGRLLKTHCAPVRDPLIDNFIDEVGKQDINSISKGLVSLLEVLENMKLDIANHQVRHLKAYFINWTYPFELKYHRNRIHRGHFDPLPSKQWFFDVQQWLQSSESNSISFQIPRDNLPLQHFVEGFLRKLVPNSGSLCKHHRRIQAAEQVDQPKPCTLAELPNTFDMDSTRVKNLSNEFLELLHLIISYNVFLQFWKDEFRDRPAPEIPFPIEIQVLGHMRAIAAGGGVSKAVPNIAAGIVKWVAELTGQFTPQTLNDVDAMDRVEQELKAQLDVNSDAMSDLLGSLLESLVLDVYDVATEYMNVDYFEIHKNLVPQPPPSTQMVQNLGPYMRKPRSSRFAELGGLSPIFVSELAELVNRTAHITVLHWRVWSHLVYLENESEDYSSR
jgi:hypothetical protein